METTRIINPSVLIEEVKKYPILYDLRKSHSVQSIEQKRRAWEVIAEGLCGTRWDSYDEMEKEGLAKEIQLKWKNIRDNFTRILRKEKEEEATGIKTRRKKYVFYDMLSFLIPYTSFKNSNFRMTPATEEIKIIKEECELGGRNAGNIIYINETRENDDSEDENSSYHTSMVDPITTTTASSAAAAASSPQPFQLIQVQSKSNGPTPSHTTVDGNIGGGGDTNAKLAKVLEQVLQVQRDDREDDAMGNKKFLLSMLPFLQKMPDDLNLEVRMQIMSVLQSYSGKGFMQG